VTRIVVDASVAVKWFLPEELSSDARMFLATDYQLLAPDLLSAEVANALWKKYRRRELDQRTATRLLRDFSRMPIEFHPAQHWSRAALAFSFRQGITVYDGLYLALAAGNRCRLVTADRRFREALRESPLRHLVGWLGETR
jgi:predicted nucleic acid-binding protein